MYCVSRTQINKADRPKLYAYLLNCCMLSKNLYNASLYRIRQNYTLQGKDSLSINEQEVLDEITRTQSCASLKKPGYNLSYKFLEKLMRVTHNPDFFSGLPMQSAQATVKAACVDFKTWLASMKAYKKHPADFTGKPKMPGYKKSSVAMVKFTNQDCVFRNSVLKFPKTRETISLPHIDSGSRLKEVQVQPYYNDFIIITIYECKDSTPQAGNKPYSCGIDFGVNNLAAIVGNDGSCLLYKGGVVKAANQWFNKQRAKYVSILDRAKQPHNTNMLNSLSKNRNNFIRNYMHKVSSDIIQHCVAHEIGTIIMGKNEGWKQNSNIGKKNNQTFVSIPFSLLQQMITYKAERAGITVIMQEESYTSKASFLDGDVIPVHKKGCSIKQVFSGKRCSRGLYKSADGTIINADLNGAANILRKAIPAAFDSIKDFSFMQQITIKNIKIVNPAKDIPKCIPAKRIEAA